MKKKRLRSGYTTGACAAAAAKAAVTLLLGAEVRKHESAEVEIPFPDGNRAGFKINDSGFDAQKDTARASVIKDAGDDPDVTHGAEIVAEATIVRKNCRGEAPSPLIIKGGKGIGTVTKPGLPVPVGQPAINPVPRKMIEEAVAEAILESGMGTACRAHTFEITIIVPNGEELAKKTLNSRLGITGGISILGTTGIVRPVSTEAWTATITSSMDVAKAMGNKEIVLSAGRTSEKAHMREFKMPDERYVLMGDHLEYSLREARKHGFKKIHLCAQWAKMVKIAMATPQTHVRFGAIDIRKAVGFLNSLGINVPQDRDFNTAREIFDFIITGNAGTIHELSLRKICNAAKKYTEEIAPGVPVTAYLVSYKGEVIAESE